PFRTQSVHVAGRGGVSMRLDLGSDNSLSTADLSQIVQVCDRFEAAWRAGTPRAIEDDLEAIDEGLRSRLFGELLALEVELRQQRGERPTVEGYLARFPGQGNLVRAVFSTTGSGGSTEEFDHPPSLAPPTD